MTRWLKATTLALALLGCAALPTQAHNGHGKHKHGRRTFLTRHANSANPTPGIPRRVARGRNRHPGTPRGPIGNVGGTGSVFHDNRGRGHGHDDILRTERNRDRDLAGAVGHGVGMGRGGGHGHGKRP